MYKTKQKRSVTGELAQVEERPLSTREVFNFVSCLYFDAQTSAGQLDVFRAWCDSKGSIEQSWLAVDQRLEEWSPHFAPKFHYFIDCILLVRTWYQF